MLGLRGVGTLNLEGVFDVFCMYFGVGVRVVEEPVKRIYKRGKEKNRDEKEKEKKSSRSIRMG